MSREKEAGRGTERQKEICHRDPEHRVLPSFPWSHPGKAKHLGFPGEVTSCWEGGGKQDPEGVWTRELNFSSKENQCSQSDDQNLES